MYKIPASIKGSVILKKATVFLLLISLLFQPGIALGLSQAQIDALNSGIYYFNTEGSISSNCSASPASSSSSSAGISNLDYAGKPILDQGQLQAIKHNQPTYVQAAQQAGIPWQVLASLHYRETGLSLTAPSNGDGQYQIVKKTYPSSGTISQQDFLQESIDAANFIKKDGAGLNNEPTPATVKNAFYLYNGKGEPLYPNQATALGFESKSQAYEGSPYVMNLADAHRDPSVAPAGSWLQYGTDPSNKDGGIGKASNQYGAYLVYVDLSGITTSGTCSSGSINCSSGNSSAQQPDNNSDAARQTVVCIAEHELSLWNSGQMKAGTDFEKYTLRRNEFWCADFVSWIYNQAGYPFGPAGSEGQSWSIPYVGNLIVPPQDSGKFVYHKEPGYVPKPGDLAIHYSTSENPPYYHVNLVDSVASGKIVLIGGDQHGSGGATGNVVNTEIINSPSDSDIIGYVGPS